MTNVQIRTESQASVEIAGAGPAGLAAAIELARAGRRVVVHEAQERVGHRFDGDFQGLENWSTDEDVLDIWRKMGLALDFAYAACNRGTVFSASGKGYPIESNKPLFYLIERGPGPDTLDTALLEQAKRAGVEVRFDSRLRDLRGDGILATGPKSADAIAVGYHFETGMADGFWAICDNVLAPLGYAYLLIWRGRGTLKSCMFSDFRREKVYLRRTVDAFRQLVGVEMRNPVAHGGCGNFHIPASAYSGRHPVAGEQAGFQDTLWGFGIRLAVSSGVLAARSLLTGEDYDRLWQRELEPQMRASVVNRALYGAIGNAGYDWLMRRITSRTNPRDSLRRQYRHSVYRRLLGPWARRRYRSLRNDIACRHDNCACVFCRGECCVESA